MWQSMRVLRRLWIHQQSRLPSTSHSLRWASTFYQSRMEYLPSNKVHSRFLVLLIR